MKLHLPERGSDTPNMLGHCELVVTGTVLISFKTDF
jgi:hypothetical protein